MFSQEPEARARGQDPRPGARGHGAEGPDGGVREARRAREEQGQEARGQPSPGGGYNKELRGVKRVSDFPHRV